MMALALPGFGAIDSRANIERAVGLIEDGQYLLARGYLEPALIDFRLYASERSRAYYLRGYSFYAQQLYVSAGKDYYRALEFNPDNPAAQAALANLHLRGQGVPRNLELAYTLLNQAAEQGHAAAQLQVAIAEMTGTGTPKDLESARSWLTGLADAGDSDALIHLARSYRAGTAEQPQPELAQQYYEQAWAAGDPDALAGLAFMHRKGELPKSDPARAVELFARAAKLGSGAAQVRLGHMYLTGDAVADDAQQAHRLFVKAADQGVGVSYLWLGHIYHAGLGIQADSDAAANWYRKAAQANVAGAHARLVNLLLQSSRPPDHREALSLLADAAREDPRAQNDFAWVLATHPLEALRDGDLAVKMAERAVAHQASATFLDTLAAAHAERGDFEAAISTQTAALILLDDAQQDLRRELAKHLAAYQAGRPWRE